MKQIRIFALALIAFASASCANDPRVLDQRALAGSSTSPATKVLIVIDSKAVIDPRVNAEIEAYKSAMSAAVQSALNPIPTQLIDITLSSRSSNPLSEPALNFRPSHIVQLLPAASSSVNGFPVKYTWRLEFDDMAVTRFAAVNGRPSGTRFDAEPAYEIRAEGDACFSSTAHAQECGASMGKVIGEALRAAPVLHIDAGA